MLPPGIQKLELGKYRGSIGSGDNCASCSMGVWPTSW